MSTSTKQEGKHTPGPWMAKGKGDYRDGGSSALHPMFAGGVVANSGQPIVTSGCLLGVMGGDSEEAEANARLIAAAPDLLAACKLSLERHVSLRESGDAGFYPEQPEEIALRAAILKAESHE